MENKAADDVVKDARSAITKAGAGGGLALACGLIGIYFVWNNWGTLSEMSRKLDAVDNNSASVAELETFYRVQYPQDKLTAANDLNTTNTLLDGRISALESARSEEQGTVGRLESRVLENSQWRVEQEQRATIRIQEHLARDERMDRQEKRMDKQDIEIDERFDVIEAWVERQKTDRQDVDIQSLRSEIEALRAVVTAISSASTTARQSPIP